MKQYDSKETKDGKYKYGYYIQRYDIKTMMDLNFPLPKKILKVANEGFNEENLDDFLYFDDPVSIEFISNQYWISETIEFANLSEYELDILEKLILEKIGALEESARKLKDKDELNSIETKILIYKNDLRGLKSIKKKSDIFKKR